MYETTSRPASGEYGLWTTICVDRDNIGSFVDHGDGEIEAFATRNHNDIPLGVFRYADETERARCEDEAHRAICDCWFARGANDNFDSREQPPPAQCADPQAAKVIKLAERARETIEITELEPANGAFIGKRVNPDGSITAQPLIKFWYQRVASMPATIAFLFIYLREARTRNVCILRDAPAKLERQPTLRQIAGIGDRGDHGFLDNPTRLLPIDFDGVRINWQADPEAAIRTIVTMLGEPWASTSFVWFFSAQHGLEFKEHECPTTGKKQKRWTGRIVDGVVRVRIVFIAERALDAAEAKSLTLTARGLVPEIDASMVDRVHINYIQRPLWIEHPDRDVLGDCPTIGWIKGAHDTLAVPDNLAHTAHWAKARGHGSSIADHPDAETAVQSIGSDRSLRSHLKAAVKHLLIANPIPDVVSFADHSLAIVDRLRRMVEQNAERIARNLATGPRSWSEVEQHLTEMPGWASWCLNNPGVLRSKTIKLVTTQDLAKKANAGAAREAIFARVARTVGLSFRDASTNEHTENPPVRLLVSPTGSGKSTQIRAFAVRYVTEHPGKTVVILVPRHQLGDEQIKQLAREHPRGRYNAAIWRGRHADDPETPDPQHPGKFRPMCQREKDVTDVEMAILDVDSGCCKYGRGKKTIKCPLYDMCAFQRQKQVKANIWFCAHECAVHEMPKAFGEVGWVIFDESPLDAFMFGVDSNDQVTLELDSLRTPLPVEIGGKYPGADSQLMLGREVLYRALDKLRVPAGFHQGAAFPLEGGLEEFIQTAFGGSVPWKSLAPILRMARAGTNIGFRIQGGSGAGPQKMRDLTWRGKVDPKIRPDMSGEQLKLKLEEAAINRTIKKEVLLWALIEALEDSRIHGDIRDVPMERLKTMLSGAAVDGEIDRDLIEGTVCRIKKEVAVWELIKIPVRRGAPYGRIQVCRGKEGRLIRMVGLERLAKGWNAPTLICDATGDAELLRPIWPQLEEPEPHGWQQLPRPSNVRILQCVDRTISKSAVAVDGKNEHRAAPARRLYAAVLKKGLEYGGEAVGVIVYKATKDWWLKHCFIPPWLELLHWGDLTGTNALQKVRALFVIGRTLPPSEAVARQAEALSGGYVSMRNYIDRPKGGRIPIVPDAEGNNAILVDVWKHPHPLAERLRRQIMEGAVIQAVGRARAGLRKTDEPLDIHLWTDVPVPELGSVEPVLWSELETGLDGLMLAQSGCWLRNKTDAVRAFKGLFTADGLKSSRAAARRVGVFPIGYIIGKTPTHGTILPIAHFVRYQRQAARCKPTEAVFLNGVADPRGWLEARLGPLAYFEIRPYDGAEEPFSADPASESGERGDFGISG